MNRELINRSIEYMLEHFDENISVKDVAAHFHYSEYYFCRAFKALTGKSVYEFMLRLKMDQSAVDLKLGKNKPITDIALDYGYSPSNYSAAFRRYHNVSPIQFRKSLHAAKRPNPFYPEGRSEFGTVQEYAGRIRIQEFNDRSVIYERVQGSYIDLKEQWPRFIEQYWDYIEPGALYIERFYDDPTITRLEDCMYDICVTVNKPCSLENQTTIQGGTYAVYHYEGKIRDIFCAVQGVFSVWLPVSGYCMDKRYGLHIYQEINENSDTVIMDLCIPIQSTGT